MRKAPLLPKFLHRYFWDVDIKRLDFCKKSQFVIQRILEIGDLKAVRWIVRNFSKNEIARTVIERRGFSSKTANFWSSFLKIPYEKVICLQKPYQQQHAVHWPY